MFNQRTSRFLVFCLFLISQTYSFAQSIDWMHDFEGGLLKIIDLDVVDDSSFVIVGYFEDTVDFDVDTSSFKLIGTKKKENVFLAKYKSDATLIWAKQIGNGKDSIKLNDILIDKNQNIYVLGSFVDSVDFDPSTSSTVKNAGKDKDGFLAKYDRNGKLLDIAQFFNVQSTFVKQISSKLQLRLVKIDTVNIGSSDYVNPNKFANYGVLIDTSFSNVTFIKEVHRWVFSDGSPVKISQDTFKGRYYYSLYIPGKWSLGLRDTIGYYYVQPIFVSSDDKVYISWNSISYLYKPPLSNTYLYTTPGTIHLGGHTTLVYDKQGINQNLPYTGSGINAANIRHSQYKSCPVSTVVTWHSIASFDNTDFYITGKKFHANHSATTLKCVLHSAPSSVYSVNTSGFLFSNNYFNIGSDTLKFNNSSSKNSFLVKFKTGCNISTNKFKVGVNGKFIFSNGDKSCGTTIDTEVRVCTGDTLVLTLDSLSGYQWDTQGSKKKIVIASNGKTITGHNKLSTCSYSDNGIKIKIITDPIIINDSINICPGDSIAIHGIFRKNAGLYSDTTHFTTGNQCDSLINNIRLKVITVSPDSLNGDTLNLCDTNGVSNAAYANIWGTKVLFTSSGIQRAVLKSSLGCDSIVDTFFIKIHLPDTTFDTLSICSKNGGGNNWGGYFWGGKARQISGLYTSTFTNGFGCDSIVELNLTVHKSYRSSPITAIGYYYCDTNNYLNKFNGHRKYITDRDTIFTTVHGCDSAIRVFYYSKPSYKIVQPTVNACDSFTWAASGKTYYKSGLYTDTLTTKSPYPGIGGCDSILSIQINIFKTATSFKVDSVNSCTNFKWPANGKLYQKNGYYQDTLSNQNGCDSIIALHLVIHNSIQFNKSDTICSGKTYYFPDGDSSKMSVIDTSLFSNNKGCDSLIITHLTVNSSDSSKAIIIACNSYKWINGIIYTSSNNSAIHKLTNSKGCDSIINLNLMINKSFLTNKYDTICQGNTFHFPDGDSSTVSTIDSSYFKGKAGCDSTIVTHLTVNSLPLVNAGFDDTICAGDTFQLNATGAMTYSWSPAMGLFVTNISNPKGILTSNQTYTVLGTDAKGCSATDQVNLVLKSVTSVSLAPLNDVCISDTAITLTAGTPAGGFYSGKGITNRSVFDPAIAGIGTHKIVYSSSLTGKCITKDSQNIVVKSGPIIIWTKIGTSCTEDQPLLLTATPTGGQFSGNGIAAGKFAPKVAGKGVHSISYTAIGTNGCKSTKTQNVSVGQSTPISPIKGQDKVAKNRIYYYALKPVNGSGYVWNVVGGTFISQTSNSSTVKWGAGNHGWISVTQTNADGCVDSTKLKILISPLSQEDLLLYGNKIQLFPNPVDQELTINFGQLIGKVTLTLLDGNGKLVKEKSIEVAPNNNEFLNVSDLGVGTYFLLIQHKNEMVTNSVVISR